nr:hypothetical protein [Prevotella sp.]
MFFTIAFLAMGGYCVATKAQNAQTASTLENLQGKEVTKENYSQLVTNGEKPSSMKDALFKDGQAQKMFLLYNKGTGKFLTFGGYWGASATLSDTPCPFWLQWRNDTKETQNSCYLRYPENEGEIWKAEKKFKTYTNKEKEFPTISTEKPFYFGSQEGDNRSQAIYKAIQIVKSNGTTTDIKVKKTNDTSDTDFHTASTDTPFEPNGKKFKTEALDVDFANGDKLVVKVNLSKCNNDKENILSIGTNIEKWLLTGDNMVHIYFTKSSKTFYIDRTWGDSQNKKETTINNLQEDVTITLSKEALTITSVEDYGYSVPYTKEKEGTLAKFKCDEDGNYVIDADGKLELTDDATGKAYYASNANINAYTYSDLPNDTYPSLFISRNIHSTEDGVGPFLAYATIRYSTYNTDNGLSEKMAGVYTDKPIYSTGDNGKKHNPEYARWQFIPTGTTGEYRLALHMNVNLETGLGYAEVNNPSLTKEATYYMTASSGYIKGDTKAIKKDDKQHYLYSTVDESGKRTYIDNFSDRYEMVKMTETPEQSGDYATWKLITAHDYLFMLNSQQSALKETIDLSAVLADPDFSRHNDGLKNWQIEQTLNNTSNVYNEAKLRVGYDGNYKTNLTALQYTFGASYDKNFNDTIDRGRTNNNFCANHSRYMCATVQNGGYGRMYQSITIDNPGWYIVRCQGLTTINAYLYATVQEGNAKAAKEFTCNLRKIDDEYLRTKLQILDAKDAYWPYDQASPMYNAAVDMNDEHVQPNHVKESTSQVLFFVESATPSAPATITFGVNVPQQTTYDTGTNNGREYSKDFTAFDSFRLLYGGQEKNEPYLILNENDENLDYLDETIHKYKSHGDIHKRLLLHRTFTKNSWNTIVLPVGLTKKQFNGAFGDNAQIAELSQLTESQIRFKTVSNSTQVTAPDGTSYEYWLKPMTPYLIKITDEGKDAPDQTDEYTAYLFNCADNGMTYQTKTIGGSDNAYYSIDDITMIEGEGFAKTKQDGNFNHWDFKDMTLSNIDNTENTYSYVIKGQETNADVYGGKMTAYGMLTRNYKKDATSGKNILLDGHSPMADAYIMTADKTTNKPVLKYKTGGGASKGFRCWFRYTTESSAAKPQFALFIDGISEPTSIEDIMNNDEGITPAEKFAHGIYSLNGQKVGDSEAAWNHLPKGIYIVNGKKVIK